MKPHLKMNLDVKKITILVFVINLLQMFFLLPTTEALIVFDDKVSITMSLKEISHIHQSLGDGLKETQVKLQSIDSGLNIISFLELQLRKKENLGLIIAKIEYEEELRAKGLIRSIKKKQVAPFLKEINPMFKNEKVTHKEEIFSLPISRTTPLMYYNIEAIRNSSCELENFTVADIPKTWQEFETLLERCQDKGGKRPLLLGGEAFDWIFQAMVSQQGGSLFDVNNELNLASPQAIKILERWQKLKKKNLINIEEFWEKPINIFKRGHSPIICFSTNGIASIVEDKEAKFKWTVGHLPIQESANVILGGFNIYWGINMTDAQIEASKDLVKLLYGDDVQQAIFEAGSWPIKRGMIAQGNSIGKGTLAVFETAVEQLNNLSTPIYSPKHTIVKKALQQAIEGCLNDGTSPREALQTAQDYTKNKK